jgi:O-antigen/teichoic acid export membrane protein
MTRGRRSILTYLSGSLKTVATMVLSLAAVPFIIQWLGEEKYGAFRATLEWFGHLALLQLGMDGALRAMLANALGREDEAALERTLRAGVHGFLRLTATMVLGGLILALSIRALVPVGTGHQSDLTLAALAATVALLVTPLSPFRALTEARQEGYVVNGLLLVQAITVTGLALLLAYYRWGIAGQFIALLAGTLVFHVAIATRELRRSVLHFRRGVGSAAEGQERRQLWSLNWTVTTHQVCGRVSFSSDQIIVALLLGPVAVVPFYITRRLGELAQGQLQGIGNAAWAALADLHARGDAATFNLRLIEVTHLVMALGIGVLVPIAAYTRHFVGLWVGPQHYAGDAVAVVAAANALLLGVVTVWAWAFGGTGKVAPILPVSIVAAALNLGISIPATWRFGLIGPLLGTFASTIATSAWYIPVLLRRTFGTSLASLTRAVAVPLAWGLPFAALVWWVSAPDRTLGWARLTVEMAAAATAYLAIWWTLMLDADHRAVYLGRFRAVIGRRS